LQCAEQAFQRGNAAKLNQRAGVVGQNDAFVNHKFSRSDTESTLPEQVEQQLNGRKTYNKFALASAFR